MSILLEIKCPDCGYEFDDEIEETCFKDFYNFECPECGIEFKVYGDGNYEKEKNKNEY